MKERWLWNRRDFLQIAGCSSLGAISARLPRSFAAIKKNDAPAPRFAYVGYAGTGNDAANASAHGIKVFTVEGGRWRPTQDVPSDHPSSLALHPGERFLYAINQVNRYENLPSGAVEAYAVDAKDGSLTLLNRQPLSLSATAPRHLAVSPDGRAVVVAIDGGGAYNVLPIDRDGSLRRVSGIRKETGSGPDQEHQQTAHPHMVLFDGTGRLLGADLGSDRLSVFTLEDGSLRVASRCAVRAGSGPRHMELHPDGRLLFVANGLDASVSCFGYDAKSGRILNQLAHVPTLAHGREENRAVVMAMHPSGEFLYTAHRSGSDGIAVWKINTNTGGLRVIQREDGLPLHAMTMAPDGGSLLALDLALDQGDGAVVRWSVDPQSGRLTRSVQVARVPSPVSLALKYL